MPSERLIIKDILWDGKAFIMVSISNLQCNEKNKVSEWEKEARFFVCFPCVCVCVCVCLCVYIYMCIYIRLA